MKTTSVSFDSPRCVSVQSEELPPLAPDKLRVQAIASAISPGTEMLVYRGEFPQEVNVDESISGLQGGFAYPIKYGYSAVGRVVELGKDVERAWIDRPVFAFHPHQSVFDAAPAEVIPIPEGIEPEEAVFLPNLETAVNFVLDGEPKIGERAAVFGQGIVGLLTTALLAQFPLAALVTVDRYPQRREASMLAGATDILDPAAGDFEVRLQALVPDGADLIFELSGSPQALNTAVKLGGYDSRVVIGSWYGSKRAELDLGGAFHRSRMRLISSQVSTIAPQLRGRWTKERRFETAWEMIRRVKPGRWITQRFPVEQAAEAYRLIDQNPGETIQVVFEY